MARSKLLYEVTLASLGQWFEPCAQGLVLRIKVKPHATREKLFLINDSLGLSVRALASENAANDRVLELLSQIFEVPKSKLEIISGHKSKHKRILFKNISLRDIGLGE